MLRISRYRREHRPRGAGPASLGVWREILGEVRGAAKAGFLLEREIRLGGVPRSCGSTVGALHPTLDCSRLGDVGESWGAGRGTPITQTTVLTCCGSNSQAPALTPPRTDSIGESSLDNPRSF